MKRITILFAFIAFIQVIAKSQSCLPDGISFYSQEDIDNFPSNYPNCTEIEGDVEIRDGAYGEITNFDGLNVLTSIGGKLEFRHSKNLKNITGFDNLASVGGHLIIALNDSLESISAFENLTHIGGSLSINTNYLLKTFAGINNLTSISESLIIQMNFDLSSIDGFASITNVGADLIIDSNYELSSMTGFEDLTTIGGKFEIGHTDYLPSLVNFHNLNSIGGNLRISLMDALTNLSGLENLSSIGGNMYIGWNYALLNISSLSNLSHIGGMVQITKNHDLTQLVGLESISVVHGSLEIDGNDLVDFSGLDNLTSIESYFKISESFSNCSGLESLTSIGQSLWISGCLGNSNFEGFDNLTTIGGSFWLSNNASLLNFNGLENLESIGGFLKIDDNDKLIDLDGLNNVSNIEGKITISDNHYLYSLSGLEGLTSFDYDIEIFDNPDLKHFTGLDNLTSIMGSLTITEISDVVSFQGFNSLVSIGQDFVLTENENLIDLSGLDQLTTIGGGLSITKNPSFTSLSGIENINAIESVYLYDNESLVEIGNLENLTSVTGLNIRSNRKLESIQGFKNIDGSSLESLKIRGNTKLSVCNIVSVCSYITVGNYADIEYNKTGCDDVEEVVTACEACFHDGASFSTQESIDNFQTDYPYCNMIYGDLIISGSDITNLDGLGQITRIFGELRIHNNDLLVSLSGLENIDAGSISKLYIRYNPLLTECGIQSICEFLNSANPDDIDIFVNALGCNRQDEVEYDCGPSSICLPQGITFTTVEEILSYLAIYSDCLEIEGDVLINSSDISDISFLKSISIVGGDLKIIDSDDLISLEGLENLTTINGDLIIGNNSKGGNPSLQNLESLSNLVAIGGNLTISNNNELKSLNGLENIDPLSITNLNITNNPKLSNCDIKSICDYLLNPSGDVTINNNEMECNSQLDIIDACSDAINDNSYESLFTIYPNPATEEIVISNNKGILLNKVTIVNQFGQVTFQHIGDIRKINVSDLSKGVYIVELCIDNTCIWKKLMIQ